MKRQRNLRAIAVAAQKASRVLATKSSEQKNRAIKQMADALVRNRSSILKANRKDVSSARGASRAFVDRLALSEQRIRQMADSLREVAKLHDPVGEVIKAWRMPNGLWIHKVRVPLGVVAIIYESRPNVTSDCAGLCFKSGNSVILRGGSESLNSNKAIFNILQDVLRKNHMPQEAICLIETRDRRAIDGLLRLDDCIDVVIPRGGEGLITHVVAVSRIPVIKHYKGICHVYVDEWADLNMAEKICLNAKLQRPGVCNAMESMLVHRDVAGRFLPGMLRKFMASGVEIRGCAMTARIVKTVKRATEQDYRTEYLDLILSVRVVDSLSQAIDHINTFGSHHSDSIVTDNYDNSLEFLKMVDSACVYVNASTRFTDGYQFGMGAEIGISTDKLHARGPMALEELTGYKYMVFGKGQIRE